MTDLKEYLRQLYYNLKALQEQEAAYQQADNEAPLHLQTQIYDHETAVNLTLQTYDGQLSLEAWAQALEPLLPSLAKARVSLSQPYHPQTAQQLVEGVLAGRPQNTMLNQTAVTLAEAKARLTVLPLDDLPALMPILPGGSYVPFSYNPFFVGRTRLLKDLARAVKGGATALITGLSGIGKSQLAREFAYRYGMFFAGGVFWLNFADRDNIQAEIARCGGSDGLNLRSDFATLSRQEQVALVMAAWRSPRPRLLIFDGCEEPGLLHYWRPASGGCRVLVTSNKLNWETRSDLQTVSVGPLKRSESLLLLHYYRPDLSSDDDDLNRLAEALDDLPLALHLAGSYLAHYQGAVADYLAQLQMQGGSRGTSPLNRAYLILTRQLKLNQEIDPIGAIVLDYLAQEAVGRPVSYERLQAVLQQQQQQIMDEEALRQSLRHLMRLGLLEDSGRGVALHPQLARQAVKQGSP